MPRLTFARDTPRRNPDMDTRRQLEGVLSRRGEGWARLSRLSHVIVDEAH